MNIRAALVAGLLAISGCTTTGLGNTKIGSAAGALAGTITGDDGGSGKVAAAIIAEMNGGLVGGQIGAGMDERDRRIALEAEYRALEHTQSGQPVTWKSDRSGLYGTVVAAQPYRVGSQDCRQYSHTVFASGQSRNARGTACRNADGSWTPLT
ncbi:MAG TPA: RT0821/Lpp0805 family surface protein [Pseudaminobacter sp.]|jgi:surface antigen|nr:RT0821/Lpp0805 family surface protein [Pseudaminobacter sp.]